MNSRYTTKMVEHKLILFASVKTLCTLVTLLIKLFRTLLKWKYIQDQNYTILVATSGVSGESEAILSKMFRHGHRGLECSYGKIFIPVTEISVAKTEISVTGPTGPLI